MKVKVRVKDPELVKKIGITSEFIKLDSLLKFAALSETGGEAKEEILGGFVKVNGETCTQRGRKIRPGDTVRAYGKVLRIVQADDDTEA